MKKKSPPDFLEFEAPPAPREKARFEVIPVPFELSVSYGHGTAKGPAAILEASQQLEVFDGRVSPADAGIYTGPAVDCRGSAERVLARIEERVGEALEGGRIPVMLGGEHTVTLGALRAMAKRGKPFGVVQFDAHADLRDRLRNDPLSHGCVMRRAVEELGVPLFQIANRAYCREEAAFRKANRILYLDAEELSLNGLPRRVLPAGFPETLYITFDVDGLDPSVVPATGTPVPGGLLWYDAIRLLRSVAKGRKIAGFDVVELAPVADSIVSDFAAARLTYAMMGLVEAEGAGRSR